MSEPIPESIPTSTTSRPTKKPRTNNNNTPVSHQSAQLSALFANPDRALTTPYGPKPAKSAPLPPEIVANVQGSSAGAGSGEFHVYKASRRRENERLRLMDEEVEREKADKEFEARQVEVRSGEEEKLGRNRAKREKAKMRKLNGRVGRMGVEGDGEGEEGGKESGSGGGVKRKLGAVKLEGMGNRGVRVPEEGGVDDGTEQAGEEEVGITFHDDD